jgi:hypothetical protein
MVGVFEFQGSKRGKCKECTKDHFKSVGKLRRMSTECQEGTRIPLKEQRAKTLRDSSKPKLRRDSAIVHEDSARSAEGENLFRFIFVEEVQVCARDKVP